jgi:GcrA cell cycle regulator
MLWTPEAVEDLKRLALEGKSASNIAAALGVASRNAVIGKASRIGIKLGGGGRGSARGKTPSPAGRSRWTTAFLTRRAAGDPGAIAALMHDPRAGCGSERGEREDSRAAWTIGEAEIGEMRRIRFEEMHDSDCRWPLGDPRSGEFAYCGLRPAEGQSYCAGHCRMAYRPTKTRPSRSERQQFRALGNSWRAV